MKRQFLNEIKAIIILALAIILTASLISFVPEDLGWYTSYPNIPPQNLISVVGAYVAGALFFVFGTSSYFLIAFLLFFSWAKLKDQEIALRWPKVLAFLVSLCSLSAFLNISTMGEAALKFQRAGLVGDMFASLLVRYWSPVGAYLILGTLLLSTFVIIFEFLISPYVFQMGTEMRTLIAGVASSLKAKEAQEQVRELAKVEQKKRSVEKKNLLQSLLARENKAKTPEPPVKPIVSVTREDETAESVSPARPVKPNIRVLEGAEKDKGKESLPAADPPKVVGQYKLPSLDLLNDPPSVSSKVVTGDLMNGAKTLEDTLADFGVAVRVADIERGPVITRYELEPAPGVKVQKITALTDDLALAMRAQTVRIVAPIPGKNRVGVEVPNASSSVVYLKDVLAQGEFRNSKSKLTLAIGKDSAGKPLVADLSDMPHLLIAGTTGAGKTVCVNSLIMSILFNATPDEVKFLMVDPKMVELSQYNKIPHVLCPSVTDPTKVSAALNWVVSEMENRYSILAKEGVRNIKGYHAKGKTMPYIVVIIDELADLMQVAAKQIESAITRLAQLSRAVGIHLMLATQRPSVDVITGVIKANFPARISFKVASKVDSRTVLDMNGSEKLLGKGDLLFLKPGDAKPIRGQCSLVSDEEIQRVLDFIATQQEPVYDDTITKKQVAAASAESADTDELYDEAVRLVIETNQASVSILQRRMKLGYTRAARLIDIMERNGIVGPYCGSKPRDLLVNREEWLMNNLKQNE